MREQCSCGASIQGRRRDVLSWRTNHWHLIAEEPEPEKQGSFSQAEHAGARGYEHGESSEGHDFPIVYARMGFNPNPPSK